MAALVDQNTQETYRTLDDDIDERPSEEHSLSTSYALVSVALVLCCVLSALGPAVADFAEYAYTNPYNDINSVDDAYDDIFLAVSINRVLAVPASFLGGLCLKKFPNKGVAFAGAAQVFAALITALMGFHGFPGYMEMIVVVIILVGFVCGFALVLVTTLVLAAHSVDAAWWINAIALSGGAGFAVGPFTYVICHYLGDGLWSFFVFALIQMILGLMLLTGTPIQLSSEYLKNKQPGPPTVIDKKSKEKTYKVALDAKPRWTTVAVLHLFCGFGCGAEFNYPLLLTTYVDLAGVATALWGDWLTYGYWTAYLIGRIVKIKYTPHPVRNFALVLPISTLCFTLWLLFPFDVYVISVISIVLGWSLNPTFPETLNLARAVTPLNVAAMTCLTLSRFLYAAIINLLLIWFSAVYDIPTAIRIVISVCFYISLPFVFAFAQLNVGYVARAFGWKGYKTVDTTDDGNGPEGMAFSDMKS